MKILLRRGGTATPGTQRRLRTRGRAWLPLADPPEDEVLPSVPRRRSTLQRHARQSRRIGLVQACQPPRADRGARTQTAAQLDAFIRDRKAARKTQPQPSESLAQWRRVRV